MAKKSTISTSQLIANVAEKFDDIPKKITKELVNSFLSAIEEEVVGGRKLRIDRIGILQVKDRKARMGRNPQTGEAIKIPASKKIAFRAAKSLKEQVVGPRRSSSKKPAKKKR